MDKTSYYRLLIFNGKIDDIDKLLNMIPKWTYNEKYIDGIQRKYIENKDKNVKVVFNLDDEIGFHSVNVLPIDPTIGDVRNKYEDGYDMSKNQKSNIKDDILYSLCIQINKIKREYNENIEDSENSINILCGIIPSIFDCEQV